MAGGLYSSSLRPSPLASSASSSSHTSFASKLLLLLTLLPLTLAAFAFVLQWRGGVDVDPVSRWSPEASHKFPGMDNTSPPLATVARSDCVLLPDTSSPSFPYYRDWKYSFESDLKPKV